MGDAQCDYRLIKERVDYVAKTQNAFAILNGDLMNNATKTSISDSYAELLTPMQQLTKVMDVLTPIKGKVLAINDGNHERRTHNKEGINLTELIARELGLLFYFCTLARIANINRVAGRFSTDYSVITGQVADAKRGPKLFDWLIWQA